MGHLLWVSSIALHYYPRKIWTTFQCVASVANGYLEARLEAIPSDPKTSESKVNERSTKCHCNNPQSHLHLH